MKVKSAMHKGAEWVAPDTPLTDVAQRMKKLDVGSIPVGENDKLVGMVTDRDIVVRGVAQEQDPKTLKLADVMSTNVRCAREDDDVDEVLSEMADTQIRRMPVVDGQQQLVGIITLGDIAAKGAEDDEEVAESFGEISTPAAPDRSGG